ncbi:MAG TPA: ERAP1-like C-terminal domain-containing protein, partial [Candidatus Polarisedimenticolaceae bacterium]|nr:ERAP1-like C-terminal domain-containing protein [Candidatus Polarisedimenticolaceae bacterium]
WDAIEDSTHQPVRALMDTWIFQPGYPVISVAKRSGGIALAQRLFRYLGDDAGLEQKWLVPIFLRAGTKRGVVTKTVLLADQELLVELPDEFHWVVVNAGGHGFYRVRYSDELMNDLKGALQSILSSVERFGLINDTWAATVAGLTPLSEYLNLIDLLRDESDINVWTTVIGSAHHLNRNLDEAQRIQLQERLRAVFAPAMQCIGWSVRQGESELESQLRGDLIAALGTVAAHKGCQAQARDLYSQYERNANAVDRNLVPALISIVAHTGTPMDYEKFYGKFKNAQTPQEEQRYLFALAGFRQSDSIDRTCRLTINGEVRTQNSPYLMRNLLLNPDARSRAWGFLKEHWDEMLRQYPDNSIPRMCEGIIGLALPDLERDVREFFARHPVKQGVKQMEQHLERLRIAVVCRERWQHQRLI